MTDVEKMATVIVRLPNGNEEVHRCEKLTIYRHANGVTIHIRLNPLAEAQRVGLFEQVTLTPRGIGIVEQLVLTPEPEPRPAPTPIEQRDEVLAAYERHRKQAVQLGRAAADELVRKNGKVTSVEVEALLREQGHGPLLDSIDARWMGAVFSPKKWHRTGLENTGSKGRAVSVWTEKRSTSAEG